MKLFFAYLKGHKRVILAYFLFCLIFGTVFALYHLPLPAVLYPAGLCALVGFLFFLLDFLKTRKKHRELSRLATLPAAMMGDLPESNSLEEGDYQTILRALQQEAADLESAANARYADMVDYYTMWAHQIKTPIAAMRLHLQSTDSPLSRELLGELGRIEQYVEMVLAFLRLDAASTDYVFRQQPIDPIIRKAVKRFSSEFIRRKIRLDYEPVAETLVTDEKWLGFVLEQLLSNALKYTREGSVHIYIKEPKTLCIADTGMGIAPEDLPRIFEKGYTGCNGRRDKQSSGLGLYLCRRVCQNLGIGISASSQLGAGTTICLDLQQYTVKM